MDKGSFFVLFWGALALLTYTYLGYPLLIGLIERIFYRPVKRQDSVDAVTILLVVHNEESVIAQKLENLLQLDYPGERVKILVACDGCSDQTADRVAAFADRGVELHVHATRRGKAAVLNDEVPGCTTELVVLADARQLWASDALTKVMANFADPKVGAVSGELMLGDPDQPGVGQGMGIYWRYEKWIRSCESGIHSTVGATGALLAVRRSLWKGLPSKTIVDDMVLPFQVVRQGYRVILERAARLFDGASPSWEREFARKTRTLSGNFQILFHPFRMQAPLFSPLTIQFLSHKVLRLLSPLLLGLCFLANYWLYRFNRAHDLSGGSWLYGGLMAGQGIFYVSALVGVLAERLRWPIPLVHTPYTFLLTQVAVICGFLRWASGRDDSIWEKTYTVDPEGMYHRLVRLFADGTIFCLGIVATFYLRYWGDPPQEIFQLFAKLNPNFELGPISLAVPLVILVPLTVFYYYRVNEPSAAEVTPEFVLNIVYAVFVSTLFMVVLIYKMRDTLTAMGEKVMVGFPSLVLILSVLVNCLLIAGWRLLWKWIRNWAMTEEGAWQDIGVICRDHPQRPLLLALEDDQATPTQISGYFGKPGCSTVPYLGGVDEVERLLPQVRLDGLQVEAEAVPDRKMAELLGELDCHQLQTGVIPGDVELLVGRSPLRLVSYIPVLGPHNPAPSEAALLFKRSVDLLAGIAFGLYGLIPWLVWRLFRSRHVGCRRRTYYGREGKVFSLCRLVAKGGKGTWGTRAVNVFYLGCGLLRGDLSLVGPRAISSRTWQSTSPLERTLLTMRPGIIGPQRVMVAGRHYIRRSFLPALFYGRNFHLGLDVTLLVDVLRQRIGGWQLRQRRAL